MTPDYERDEYSAEWLASLASADAAKPPAPVLDDDCITGKALLAIIVLLGEQDGITRADVEGIPGAARAMAVLERNEMITRDVDGKLRKVSIGALNMYRRKARVLEDQCKLLESKVLALKKQQEAKQS